MDNAEIRNEIQNDDAHLKNTVLKSKIQKVGSEEIPVLGTGDFKYGTQKNV